MNITIHKYFIIKVDEEVNINGKKSTHNGLIGMLERGEIDIAVSSLSQTLSRTKVK